ncbi:hypothetical protein OS493_014708 [Desmophyllum pertusum]|uniref:Uncharacterized protein n=1 Tax=Desmophyllum pertusum TaxID=174260 RepID=A0A9W9YD25_9CNID|nr:hypothetical protein OS493_014708 [Desmophyllum pertusum]
MKTVNFFGISGGSMMKLKATGTWFCQQEWFFDPSEETFLVCDWGSSSIQTYKPDGTFLGAFPIDGRPTDIALFNDGTLVVSSKDDQWIQFMSISPLGALKVNDAEKE